MHNHSYVCWACREVRRAEYAQEGLIKCPKCGNQCVELGKTARVPKKDDAKGWNLLRQLHEEGRI
jgi:DNA-directed RNA polymerase subunit RPC12/RpoP